MEIEEIGNLALALMSQYGLTEQGWKISYTKKPDINATCVYKKKKIELSAWTLPFFKPNVVKDLILHEIAHVLAPGDGHGKKWKKIFKNIGGSGKIFIRWDQSIAHKSLFKQVSKYTYICDICHKQMPSFTKPNNNNPKSCGYCSPGEFNPLYIMKYVKNY